MPYKPHSDYFINLAIVIAFGGAVYYIYHKHQKRIKLPNEWKQVGTLKDLLIYPVKSCRPIILEEAECTVLGLKKGWLRDRSLMVTTNENEFITARDYPGLLLIQPTIKDTVMKLEHSSTTPLFVDLEKVVAAGPTVTARIWRVPVSVHDCGPEPKDWFTSRLRRNSDDCKLKLVYYASKNTSQLRPKKSNKVFKFRNNDAGALQDEASYNLINEASIEDLNARLIDSVVTALNFRPNFVLRGAEPYDEDNWNFVKIGENVFEIVKPCIRCIITTMDPKTGERNLQSEPLQTLRRYREIPDPAIREVVVGSTSRMGVHLALRSRSNVPISVGDPVFVA